MKHFSLLNERGPIYGINICFKNRGVFHFFMGGLDQHKIGIKLMPCVDWNFACISSPEF